MSDTATAKIKEARRLAEKYRSRWCDDHADNVANLEDYTSEERYRYYETCLTANRLPWERKK